jgi:alpha-galactosidase
MKKLRTSRRRFLQLATSAGVATKAFDLLAKAPGQESPPSLSDGRVQLEFDPQMRMRVSSGSGVANGAVQGSASALTSWSAPEALSLRNGKRLDSFILKAHSQQAISSGPLGKGTRLRLAGESDTPHLEKTVVVELYHDYPGFALYQVSYRNLASEPVLLAGWSQLALTVPHEHAGSNEPAFWSFCGSTHQDRRDWVQPVRVGFKQDNFMGMEASDYGGGTPIVDVWRPNGGLAIGHIETTPRLVSLPLNCGEDELTLAMTAQIAAPDSTQVPGQGATQMAAQAGQSILPGAELVLPQAFVATHSGDYFATLDAYRRIMAVRGIASPKPPKAAYDAVWCAWGYERDCTLQLIIDTLPKVRELGLRWAVIDDGWQTNVGDWKVSTVRYPGGEADMRGLVKKIRSFDLEARLWWAPLAVAPGADLLHDHPDMLLLDKDGSVQKVSWWNSFYLCPGYQPTVDYMAGLVRKFIGDWGYAGLKIDGQHLNSVAPCYNPAHKHARPEESVEKLQEFFAAIYQAAVESNPQAVVELCPCGTSYSFFNFRSFNSAPASDPESSWQVRHKGKSLKALMGPSAAFAGDHVELSAGGDDFASTVGIGGIVSTKFTWPVDPKPKDSFLLTPAKEPIWRKWIGLYNDKQLPLGTYRGELYDIGFDKPETHVIEKAGRFYYAFYGRNFSGLVPLRGLKGGRYKVRDYYNERDLGEVSGKSNQLQIAFNDFLVLEAVPV